MVKREDTENNPAALVWWPLLLTRTGMIAERVVTSFWLVWTIAFAVFSAMTFGLHEVLPFALLWVAIFLSSAGMVWAFLTGVRKFRWPSVQQAQERLDETLAGRPLAALNDALAIGAADEQSRAVWKAHRARMIVRLQEARTVVPDLRISHRDPFGLRHVAFAALLVALLFGSVGRVATVAVHATTPGGGADLALGPSWEGWVEPPAYTGRPSLYLNDIAAGTLTVAQGSTVTLRFYGEAGALTLEQDIAAPQPPLAPDATFMQHKFDVEREGGLSIAGPGGRDWGVKIIPDEKPIVMVVDALQAGRGGEIQQPFQASDDYGVVGGRVTVSLDLDRVERKYGLAIAPEPRDPIVLDLPLPIHGDRADFEEVMVENFSDHPWARMPVIMLFEVEDALAQISDGELMFRNLGGRRFFDPVAAALIELRRDLLWSRKNGRRVSQLLKTVLYVPEDLGLKSPVYLKLRTLSRRLDAALTDGLDAETRDAFAATLWEVALEIEEGDFSDAKERLERAQDRLAEAIRNGASDEEIAELMEELRRAMDDYMRQLAEQAQPEQNLDTAQNENGQEMTQQDLQSMMDRIQELMEQGRMAEAMELLEQLRQMTENMRVTQGEGQGPGQQALQGLAETLRNQQGLSDDAFRELQDQYNPGQPGMPQQNGEGQQPGEGGEGLAQRQGDLRRQLQEQLRNLPGLGGEQGQATREALDRAGRAMDRAEEALRGDNLSGALDDQADAMDALREGMRNLGEALAQQQQDGDQGQAMGDPNSQGNRDPLGRDGSGSGRFVGTDEGLLQGDDVYDRARELMDEIRRRSSEQERPELELEYLKRLLERF